MSNSKNNFGNNTRSNLAIGDFNNNTINETPPVEDLCARMTEDLPIKVGDLSYYPNAKVNFMGTPSLLGYINDDPLHSVVVMIFSKKEIDQSKLNLQLECIEQRSHPNFLKIQCKVKEGEKFLIAFNYSINDKPWVLSDLKDKDVKIQKKMVCKGLAEGLEFLHKVELVLGSFQPKNVLMYKDGHAKIINLSFRKTQLNVETPTKKSNIHDLARIFEFVHSGNVSPSNLVAELIQRMKLPKSEDRPNITTVLKAFYFNTFEDTEVFLGIIHSNNETKTNETFSNAMIDFESDAKILFGEPTNVHNFIENRIDLCLYKNLLVTENSLKSFFGLVLSMRNKREHRYENNFQDCVGVMGTTAESHLRYWDLRFPGLFNLIYKHFGYLL